MDEKGTGKPVNEGGSGARAERRKATRHPVDLSVRFRLINRADLSKSEEVYHRGRIKDMSLLGMCIETPIRMSVGQELELFAEDRFLGESFCAIVETVRFAERGTDWEIGTLILQKDAL